MKRGITTIALLTSVAANAQSVADDARAFGARPAIEDISLSPDGKRIAFVAPGSGLSSTLYTVAIGDGAEPRGALAVSGAPDRLSWCRFVSGSRLVCTIWGSFIAPGYTRPMSYSRIVATDEAGGNQKMLTGRQVNQRTATFYGGAVRDWLPGEDGQVLMDREYSRTDTIDTNIGTTRSGTGVDRVDTRTGQHRTVEAPRPNAVDFISDGRGTIRIAGYQLAAGTGQVDGRISYRYRKAGSNDWLEMGVYDSIKEEGFNPYGIDPVANIVYGLRKKDGRQALFTRALDGSDTEVLVLSRPDVDIDGLIRVGRDRHIVGATYVTDKRTAVYFDPAVKADLASLHRALPALPIIDIVDASSDGKQLLVHAAADTDPGRYYLFDKATKTLKVLMQDRPQLDGRKLASVQAITYPAQDGTMIPAYLTMPATGATKGLRAIVMPHGGPSARDEWGFDWLAQFYAARGYAVIQPNYRGSSGYGDAYLMKNGFRAWRTAVGDTSDAGRWLVKQGIADPGKLAIVGWSYGGYAALEAGVLDPQLFKAIVAIAPVTDPASLTDQLRDYANYRVNKDYIGTLEAGASPAKNAGQIAAPVLLFHGTLDSNVAYSQSKLMNDRLKSAGKSSELITFDGLDHQIYDSAARAQILERSDAFLRAATGG
ncbi:dipeptidyl aminopeptidase/acylaminoacyl peptidase [Sphingomonas sp. BK036]|nr:S9 family peptidase [Sphingomonas sp. BK036]RZT55031.1 dipeptidyl aminopeptidase/acylaminoacyl peptidase [Sphingomonas sp. BK036]